MLKSKVLIHIALLTSLLLAVWTSAASAYDTYASGGTSPNRTGNCAACHGDYRASPYISLADGGNWVDGLHDVHRNTMLGGDCATCHTGANRIPTFLGLSDGGTGLDPISCVGCHGRSEGGTVTGAGLRQHHFINGIIGCATCHPDDSDPAGFTTVGEDILPPYYFTPDASHVNKPTDSCSPNGEEDFAATAIGLDNDGDGTYDQNDSDCGPDINLSPATLNFGDVPSGSSVVLNTAVQNLGNADLNVSTIALCAGTSTEFSWLPPAPFTLTPGASQTLAVTYAPVDDGLDTGCLEISSNDPDEATKRLLLNQGSSIFIFVPAFIRPDQTKGQ